MSRLDYDVLKNYWQKLLATLRKLYGTRKPPSQWALRCAKSLLNEFYGTAWLSKYRKTGKDVCLKIGVAQTVWNKWPRVNSHPDLASSKRVRRSWRSLPFWSSCAKDTFPTTMFARSWTYRLTKPLLPTREVCVCLCLWCLWCGVCDCGVGVCVCMCACICQYVSVVCCVRVLMHVCVFAWHCNYLYLVHVIHNTYMCCVCVCGCSVLCMCLHDMWVYVYCDVCTCVHVFLYVLCTCVCMCVHVWVYVYVYM